jgi:hypothetical protein
VFHVNVMVYNVLNKARFNALYLLLANRFYSFKK